MLRTYWASRAVPQQWAPLDVHHSDCRLSLRLYPVCPSVLSPCFPSSVSVQVPGSPCDWATSSVFAVVAVDDLPENRIQYNFWKVMNKSSTEKIYKIGIIWNFPSWKVRYPAFWYFFNWPKICMYSLNFCVTTTLWLIFRAVETSCSVKETNYFLTSIGTAGAPLRLTRMRGTAAPGWLMPGRGMPPRGGVELDDEAGAKPEPSWVWGGKGAEPRWWLLPPAAEEEEEVTKNDCSAPPPRRERWRWIEEGLAEIS